MLKKVFFSLIYSILFLSVSAYAQDNRLTFSPERPVAGKLVKISYEPLPQMIGKDSIKVLVYSFNDFKWETSEYSLTQKNEKWEMSFNISSNASLLIFKFFAGTITDNCDNKAFACMISDDSGRFMPGAQAGWGLFRSKNYGYEIPDYLDLDKVGISDSIVNYWLDLDIHSRTESGVPLSLLYVSSSINAKMNNISQRANRVTDYLLKVGSEDALIKANGIAILMDKSSLADSISNLILEKYPNGNWAFLSQYRTMSRESDIAKKRTQILALVTNYSEKDLDESFLKAYNIDYNNLYQIILLMDMDKQQQLTDFYKYVPKMSLGTSVDAFYKMIQIPHMRKDTTDLSLLAPATFLVDHIEKVKEVKFPTYWFVSNEEWAKESDRILASNVFITYTEILKNTGNYMKALTYARKAQFALEYKSAALNEIMAVLLEKTGSVKELQELLEKSVYANQTSEMMMGMLKNLYYKSHKSYDGYEAYLKGLKNTKNMADLLETVEKYRASGVMNAWKMRDASGNLVTSEQMKGKVYVLDFWASWCVPCKASFPGMKTAVEHYKNDKDVAFFFVDTQEYMKDYKAKAVSYLKEQNYPFALLFDNKEEGRKTNDVLFKQLASSRSISGIPLKVIVDKQGNVQFISIGYKGSPSELADELMVMIEQAKKAH